MDNGESSKSREHFQLLLHRHTQYDNSDFCAVFVYHVAVSLGLQAFQIEKFNWEARKNEIGRQEKMCTFKSTVLLEDNRSVPCSGYEL